MIRLNHAKQNKTFILIGFILTCLYVLTKIHAPTMFSNAIGLPIVLLGFYSIYRYGKDLQVKIPMLLLLASILIPLISWYFAHASYPELTDDSPRLDKLSRIFLFIPIAWWLKDSSKKVFVFWGLAALVIIFAPWFSGGGGWQEIVSGFHGTRIVFGLRNGQHASLFFGLVFIGLICFSYRIFKCRKWTIFLLLPLIFFCIFAIMSSLVRASWLGLIITSIVAFIYFLTLDKKEIIFNKNFFLIVILLSLIVSSVIYNSMGQTLKKRATSEPNVISQLVSGNIKNIPYTSIGIRIHMWEASIEKIKVRPITGWGSKGQFIAIHNTDWMPKFVKQNFGHIHNIYIALLTNYGFVGLIFYFVWIGWLLIRVMKAVSAGYLTKDIGFFTLTAITFWSIMGIFESYLFFWTGVFCLQIIFGGLLALIWQAEIKEKQQSNLSIE